jgi:hypothetical protein
VAAIVCAFVLTASVTFGVVASHIRPAGAASTTTAPCATSELIVWLDTVGNGTAGGTYYNLEFTNPYGNACTLEGYAGVSAVDLAGHQFGSAASRDATGPVSPVTLARGATLTAVLKITDTGVYGPASCHSVTAAGLRVYPPGQTASKVVPFPFEACSLAGPIYLRVEAVEKGILPG